MTANSPLPTWQQRLKQGNAVQPEDSLWLRVLVQTLVTVGIASVTVAAAGVTETSWFNLAAIPISWVGAIWSWRRRHRSNMAAKFCIAIGMLVALAVFLAEMFGRGGDARVLLAELLIHLQVFHSFDLPRRKDLGYSSIIGLILIGVAATVSQTFTFAPLLLVFLVVALPVLVLDYRSRLGLLGQSWQRGPGKLGLGRLGTVLVLVLVLGLGIFALLPRMPGYQLRNFPISATIDAPGQFDGSQINNPGYSISLGSGTGDGDEDGEGSGTGTGDFDLPGQMDDTYYYGFNQRMNQNLRGTLTPKVVMRVRSQAEGFWRVMAFDRYTGQGWEVSRNDEIEVLERSRLSFQTRLPWSPTRSERREVIQTYTMVDNLPNVIPAMYQPSDIYFPTTEIGIDPEGTLRSPVGFEEGITYTVISQVRYRDRTLLRSAPTTYPAGIERHYLQMPADLRDRVREQAETLLATSEQPFTDPYEKALYLAQALKQRYTIQNDLPFFDESEDLVEAFLFTYGGGYPDHFPTVLTVMLRALDIPARLMVGFSSGEFNPFTGFYVVKNTDAHALTEVYFPEHGWFAFDPIPGHPLIPPSIEEFQAFSVLRQFWNWVAGWLPSPVTGLLTGLFGAIGSALSALVAWLTPLFGRDWVMIILSGAGVIAAGFVIWLGAWGWQRWRHQRWLHQLAPMETLYQRMLDWLAQQGFPKLPHQTPLEYAQHLSRQPRFTKAPIVSEISDAYARWRYGGQDQNLDYLRQLLQSLTRDRTRAKRRDNGRSQRLNLRP